MPRGVPGSIPSIALEWILLASLLATTACVRESEPPAPSGICPAMTGVTSVQILLPPGAPFRKNAYRITDPDAVRRVVDFVNLRRDVAPSSADEPPSPRLRAMFYDRGRVLGVFGVAEGTFYFQCTSLSVTIRGTRQASMPETSEFQQLIAPPAQ